MFETWKDSATRMLNELPKLQLGYPLDDNVIVKPDTSLVARTVLMRRCKVPDESLVGFYEECDGISWPDVHNGYFLRQLNEIAGPLQDGMPASISATAKKPILVIGSTGGGSLFAVDCLSSEVLILPLGKVVDGVYEDHSNAISVVSKNVYGFAERLLEDLSAFLKCRRDHQYLA